MVFNNKDNAHLYLKNGQKSDWSKVTHIGIGAHQDDLEFMGASIILECKNHEDFNFLGIICTDGRSSSRKGSFAQVSDQEMVKLRQNEQIKAAEIGEYFGVLQLGYQSAALKKDPSTFKQLTEDLKLVFGSTKAQVMVTHNPFDKHSTHLTVLRSVVDSLKELGTSPEQFLGAEVWRGLDWLPDSLKVIKTLTASEEELRELMEVFSTQIEGGKDYARAVLGRKKSNATFFQSHQGDRSEWAELFVDLKSLLQGVSVEEFKSSILKKFENDLDQNWKESALWK